MTKAMLVAALLLCSCSGEGESAPQPITNEAAAPAPAPAQDRIVQQEDALLDFAYGWPAQAVAIAKLNARLEEDLAKQRAEAVGFAKEDRESRGPDIPFHGHYFHKQWALMGDGGRLLSLAASIETFTGGAHGNQNWEAILWDRTADEAIEVADLFVQPDRAFAAMTPVYCRTLDEQRAEKRGEPLPLEGEEWMTGCRPLAESTVAPVDGNGDGRFDLLRVLIAPYEAGPYAEGSYEVDITLTPELKAMIKPEFGGSF